MIRRPIQAVLTALLALTACPPAPTPTPTPEPDAGCRETGCGPDEWCYDAEGLCLGLVFPDGGLFDAGQARTCSPACGGAASHCDPRTGGCAECLVQWHCRAPRPFCVASTCVECELDQDCGFGSLGCELSTHTCRQAVTPDAGPPDGGASDGGVADGGAADAGPGVPNDSCAAPEPIAFADGGLSTSFQVDTSLARDDHFAICNPFVGGPEAVYELSLAAASDVKVTAQAAPGSPADPVLSLRRAPCADAGEVACVDEPLPARDELKAYNLAAGSYFLFVESFGAASGPTDVTVSLSGPTPPPPNDRCAGATLVDLGDGGTVFTFTVDPTAAADDYASPCSFFPRPELVYRLALAARADVQITSTRSAGSTGDPLITLGADPCGLGPNLGCAQRTAPNPDVLRFSALAAGDYYLFVEALSPGLFDVTVALSPPTPPPANDTCATPALLDFFGTNSASGSGSTNGATNGNAAGSAAPSCSALAASVGPDVNYRFTLTAAQDVDVTVNSADFVPLIYLRKPGQCGSTQASDEVGCGRSLSLTDLSPGTWELWIDSQDRRSGAFSVNVTRRPPSTAPPNDSCATPTDVVFADGGSLTRFAANPLKAQDDYALSCNTAQSGETVYRLNLPTARDVRITARADAGIDPVIALRGSPCGTGAELACDDQINAPEVLQVPNLAAGDYYLLTESFGPPRGTYDVTVELGPPTLAAPNDDCPGALPLVFDAGVAVAAGSTLGGTSSNPAGSPTCAPAPGRDLVYSYTLATAQDVSIEVLPRSADGLRPVVYVRKPGACASTSAADEAGCASSPGPAWPTRLELPNQAPGTWFVFVDGLGPAGAFVLEVTARPPASPPANDTCAAAEAIATLPATLRGETRLASDDLTSPCQQGAGAEVVYSFTTGSPGQLTATATPVLGSPISPSLYLRPLADCAAPADAGAVGCVGSPGSGQSSTLVVSSLDAGAWALVVEAAPGTEGPFELQLSLGPVATPPANEACATAVTLPLSGGQATAGGTTFGATSNFSVQCVSSFGTGPDVAYQFAAPALQSGQTSLTTRVSVVSHNALEYLPLVQLKNACTLASNLACGTGTAPAQEAMAVRQFLTPSSTTIVWVDALPPSPGGPFTLGVSVAPSPAPNDVCAGATPLAVNSSVTGSTVGAASDFSGYTSDACAASMGGPEVLYTLVPLATGKVTVRVVPERGYDPAVAVLSSCAANACVAVRDSGRNGDAETLSFFAEEGRTYWLAIDNAARQFGGAERGGFVLEVSQRP